MLERAIKLAKSIVNLEIYDITEDEKSPDGTIDLGLFFGKRIMKFAEEFSEDSLMDTITEFMVWYRKNEQHHDAMEYTIEEIIQRYCDRKSKGEITIE